MYFKENDQHGEDENQDYHQTSEFLDALHEEILNFLLEIYKNKSIALLCSFYKDHFVLSHCFFSIFKI